MVVAPLIIILDQATKYLINSKMFIGERTAVISSFFDIVHYTNKGAAFGIFSGSWSEAWREPFFYVISVVALVAIALVIVKLPDSERLTAVALALVVGGIFGNGIDRIRLGEVTDFLSFHIGNASLWGFRLEWPAFNIADFAISIAMILLLISVFKFNTNECTNAPTHQRTK